VVSAAVVQSMAEHHWWSYFGRTPPTPLPRRVAEVTDGDTLLHPRAYYLLSALALRAAGISGVMASYWALRVLSALLALATAVLVWAGTRRAFGTWTAQGTLGLLAVQPQLALVSTAATPDALVNLTGALIWYGAARAAAGPRRLAPFVLALGAAILGALAKRAGFPQLLMAAGLGLTLVLLALRERRLGRAVLLGAGIASAVAALSAVALLPEWVRAYQYGTDIFRMPTLTESTADPDFLRHFSRNFFQSGWLNAGWLTLPATWRWYSVALTVNALALLALVVLAAPSTDGRTRLMILLAVVFVTIQIGAIYATYFRAGYPAQGRHAFPVAGPMLSLVWIGATGWVPARWRGLPAVLLLATAAWLDLRAWTDVIVPGFDRW
jgi:hypothetical protein